MTSVPHNRRDDGNELSTETLPRFPNWFRQLLGFGTLLAAVILYAEKVKSDVRDIATRSEQREQRLLTVEARTEKIYADLGDIKADVRFLRQVMEQLAKQKP